MVDGCERGAIQGHHIEPVDAGRGWKGLVPDPDDALRRAPAVAGVDLLELIVTGDDDIAADAAGLRRDALCEVPGDAPFARPALGRCRPPCLPGGHPRDAGDAERADGRRRAIDPAGLGRAVAVADVGLPGPTRLVQLPVAGERPTDVAEGRVQGGEVRVIDGGLGRRVGDEHEHRIIQGLEEAAQRRDAGAGGVESILRQELQAGPVEHVDLQPGVNRLRQTSRHDLIR